MLTYNRVTQTLIARHKV